MTDAMEFHVNEAIRGLLDVAKVALGSGGPELSTEEAVELMIRLLAVIERSMPADLQAQDPRVQIGRMVLDSMKQ